MLAYYSSLIKKEDITQRISSDAEDLAIIANDFVCDTKVLSVMCRNRNLENSLESVQKLSEQAKIINAMITNIKENLDSYAASLLPLKKEEAVEKEAQEANGEQPKQEAGQDQISSLVEALKSMKEIQASLTK